MTLRHPALSFAASCEVFQADADQFGSIEGWLTRGISEGRLTTKQAGDLFEVFTEALLRTDPVIGAKDVWPQGRIPDWVHARLKLSSSDRGVDGVYLTNEDDLCAYQVKFRSRDETLSWRDLSTFVGLSEFAHRRLVITNAGGIAREAYTRPNLNCILGSDLRLLSRSDLTRIHTLIRANVILPRKALKRNAHQIEAIDCLLRELAVNSRATALMACGSGKTLVGLWVAEGLFAEHQSARILVLVPSLALVSQTIKEWSSAHSWGTAFHSCCVCSDQTVAESDGIELNPHELPIPVTTDPAAIERFLDGSGIRVVFSTYQSSERVREASKAVEFDLAICDEAHRTARAGHSDFTLPLDEERLPIRRRLFMTATRRVFRESIRTTSEVHSMDDPQLYGRIAYSLNFRQAADRDIICPYKVLVSVVTKAELHDYVRRSGVAIDGRIRSFEEIAGRYALAHAIKRLGLRKAFTFHRTVASAASFVAPGGLGLDHFLPGFGCFHVSGSMSTSTREGRMDEFKRAEAALVSNARCLNEGVDVPAVDLVAFMDPKRSMIDIIQAIGRALRKPANSTKTYGYILLPVYIDAEAADSLDSQVADSEFHDVWYVLRALMAQDLQLTETIERLRVSQLRAHDTPQLRAQIDEGAKLVSDFVRIIGSAEVERVLESSIKTQVVEELGEFARCYARDPQPYAVIDGIEAKVHAFLARKFGQEVTIRRKAGSTLDNSITFAISCSNAKVYMEKYTFFNAITPEDRLKDFFVIWSSYCRYGFVVPTTRLVGFLTEANCNKKKQGRYDWNVLTSYGPHGDFMKFDGELKDVTDCRVDFLDSVTD